MTSLERAAIRKKYAGLRHDEIVKRDQKLKEAEADRKQRHAELEAQHKANVKQIKEDWNFAMLELLDKENSELGGF